MGMIITIAAGVLLALMILPFLGPIGMILGAIGVVALVGYMWMNMFASIKAEIEADKARGPVETYESKIKKSTQYQQGAAQMEELLALTKAQHGARSMQYKMILQQRFNNFLKRGSFRVEDAANRAELVNCLNKMAQVEDAQVKEKAEALGKEILTNYDYLCSTYLPDSEFKELKTLEDIKQAEEDAKGELRGAIFIGGLFGVFPVGTALLLYVVGVYEWYLWFPFIGGAVFLWVGISGFLHYRRHKKYIKQSKEKLRR